MGALTYTTLSGVELYANPVRVDVGWFRFSREREARPWALLLDPYRVPKAAWFRLITEIRQSARFRLITEIGPNA